MSPKIFRRPQGGTAPRKRVVYKVSLLRQKADEKIGQCKRERGGMRVVRSICRERNHIRRPYHIRNIPSAHVHAGAVAYIVAPIVPSALFRFKIFTGTFYKNIVWEKFIFFRLCKKKTVFKPVFQPFFTSGREGVCLVPDVGIIPDKYFRKKKQCFKNIGTAPSVFNMLLDIKDERTCRF